MRKWLKITLISLSSLLGTALLLGLTAIYLVFTPARLTGIVNKLSDQIILCENHFERVDLSLFRTFPNLGLEVSNVVLVNPTEGSDNDTLAHIGSLIVGINLRDYISNRDIKVERLLIDHLKANAYIAPDGSTNYDIFPPSSDTSSSEPFQLPDTLSLKKLNIKHINLALTDHKDGLTALLRDADLNVKGHYANDTIDAGLTFSIPQLCYQMDTAFLDAQLEGLSLRIDETGPLSELACKLNLRVDQGSLGINGEPYINPLLFQRKRLLELDCNSTLNLEKMEFDLHPATLTLANHAIAFHCDGFLHAAPQHIDYNLHFSTNPWKVSEVLHLLPASIARMLPSGMDYDACVQITSGCFNPNNITAQVVLHQGTFAMPEALPYPLRDIDADILVKLGLESNHANATINLLKVSTPKSRINISGQVDNLLENALANLRIKGNMELVDLHPFLPDSLVASGQAQLNIKAKATLEQITNVDLKNMEISGSIDAKEFYFCLDNDLQASAPQAHIDMCIPALHHTESFREMLSARISAPLLQADLHSANLNLRLTEARIEAGISDIIDPQEPFRLAATLQSDILTGNLDSIATRVSQPDIRFEMVPSSDDHARVHYTLDYRSGALFARLSDSLSLDLAGLTIDGTANYDSTRSNALAQWNPSLNIGLKRAYINHSGLQYMLQVPDLKLTYRPERCDIASANIVFGNSDYYLSGTVTGLEQWLSHEAMLHGDLQFTSNYTNVDDLLMALSGLGTDPDSLQQQRQEDNAPREAHPFIVPRDVDFTLHTRIKDCTAFGNDLQELAGDITVRDGVAILDQVGFVCKAATMQLTALYRTPRVNHIFLGMDFHLLNINISELIDMIPMVDTIVPMLSSLEGRADFHLCAETYVDALYQPKYSTLRGAASLKGDSLVVIDSETFSTIAKYLRFNKKTQNIIDSLDVQLTVFRKEVELFPFLLSMDNYQVVAAGRHNLDMSYNYHLELIHSPLPTRLAVDALGVMPKIGIKLSKCRYPNLYRPERSNALEQRTMEFKQLIHNSLEANVREIRSRH